MRDCASSLAQLLESDLLQAGWDPSFIGPRTPDDECYQFVAGALVKSLLKKFSRRFENEASVDKDGRKGLPERSTRALALFLENNQDCGAWCQKPSLDDTIRSAQEEVKVILEDFCWIDGVEPVLSLGKCFSFLNVGKGQSIGTTNSDLYSKMTSSALTTSRSDLLPFYKQHTSGYPLWNAVETRRMKRLGTRVVPGSNLFFVPKNTEIDRVACTEPLLEMMYQKGAQELLERRGRAYFGISLNIQPDKNRALARVGSLTGQFATIDLKSASDRNSRSMISEYFPAPFVSVLERIRSRDTVLPDGTVIPLHMMSSMGNAFTFPLQTILFAAVVEACYRTLRIPIRRPYGRNLGNYSVFGDDIICVAQAYELVCAVLESLGHKVNFDKSFNSGPFRESCGHDWYLGRNVRGVYIQHLEDRMDFYSAINRLNAWSARHMVPLKGSIQFLLDQVKDKRGRVLFVPLHETEVAGLRIPFELVPKGHTKWHPTYGSSYRALTTDCYRVDLTSVQSFRKALEQARRVRRLNETLDAGYLRKVRVDTKSANLLKTRYDALAVLLASVAGRLWDGSYVVKEHRRRTVVRNRHSSCWNWVGSVPAERQVGDQFYLASQENFGEILLNSSTQA